MIHHVLAERDDKGPPKSPSTCGQSSMSILPPDRRAPSKGPIKPLVIDSIIT